MGFLMPPYPLTNFEIQKYYKNETRFNVFSRNNLFKKIKDGVYIINLDEYADIGTHWIALFCKKKKKKKEIVYFIVFLKSYSGNCIVLLLNIFLKKLKNLSEIKIQKLIFFEYKKTMQ